MSFPSASGATVAGETPDRLQVICLCADWCGTCRDYREGFNALAEDFPMAGFGWLDIEEQADDLGDLDIENFPTILILRRGDVLFYGTLLPYVAHLRRLIETLAAQTPEQSRAYASSTPDHRHWQENDDLVQLGRLFADE